MGSLFSYADSQRPVFVSQHGQCYHNRFCRYYELCILSFSNYSIAQTAGYRPCQFCSSTSLVNPVVFLTKTGSRYHHSFCRHRSKFVKAVPLNQVPAKCQPCQLCQFRSGFVPLDACDIASLNDKFDWLEPLSRRSGSRSCVWKVARRDGASMSVLKIGSESNLKAEVDALTALPQCEHIIKLLNLVTLPRNYVALELSFVSGRPFHPVSFLQLRQQSQQLFLVCFSTSNLFQLYVRLWIIFIPADIYMVTSPATTFLSTMTAL